MQVGTQTPKFLTNLLSSSREAYRCPENGGRKFPRNVCTYIKKPQTLTQHSKLLVAPNPFCSQNEERNLALQAVEFTSLDMDIFRRVGKMVKSY